MVVFVLVLFLSFCAIAYFAVQRRADREHIAIIDNGTFVGVMHINHRHVVVDEGKANSATHHIGDYPALVGKACRIVRQSVERADDGYLIAKIYYAISMDDTKEQQEFQQHFIKFTGNYSIDDATTYTKYMFPIGSRDVCGQEAVAVWLAINQRKQNQLNKGNI